MPQLNEYTKKKMELPEEFQKWKSDPSSDNYDALVQKLNPIISAGITSFGSPDLKLRAHILVNKALQTYDANKGASLNTHVYNNLQGLHRYKAQRNAAIHTPERVLLDRNRLYAFEKDYHDAHGVLPSDQTVADQLKISPKRVKKARAVGESPELFSEKGDQITDGKGKTSDDVWLDYVYHDLDDVNKKIFEWTSGYNNAKVLPKHVIAKKLGITAPAVSSRISTISRKIEDGLDDGTRDL